MHHSGHTQGGDDGCPKCRINGRLMAPLAALLAESSDSDAASELANTTATAVVIYDTLFGVDAKPTKFDGCEHAAKLVAWIVDPSSADDSEMEQWTAEILDDIAEMVGPKAKVTP